jgi:hypothetical protein
MYCELTHDKDVVFSVLNNLCEDTVIELKAIFGDDYVNKTWVTINKNKMYLIRLKCSNAPVGLFGLISLKKYKKSAGIFLLTTDDLHKGNMFTFLKCAKKQVDSWADEYDLIMDNCYKKNLKIKKWLKLLNFKPSEYQDDDFQIYYRGNINEYY